MSATQRDGHSRQTPVGRTYWSQDSRHEIGYARADAEAI
jgi:hypothetical protein